MGAMIHVRRYQGPVEALGRTGETEDEVLQQRLIRYVEEEDLEEIIEARWERLQEEKVEYISYGRDLMQVRVHPVV